MNFKGFAGVTVSFGNMKKKYHSHITTPYCKCSSSSKIALLETGFILYQLNVFSPIKAVFLVSVCGKETVPFTNPLMFR